MYDHKTETAPCRFRMNHKAKPASDCGEAPGQSLHHLSNSFHGIKYSCELGPPPSEAALLAVLHFQEWRARKHRVSPLCFSPSLNIKNGLSVATTVCGAAVLSFTPPLHFRKNKIPPVNAGLTLSACSLFLAGLKTPL